MKNTKPRYNLIKAMVEIVVGNWGLKLLALALALVIYFSMKPHKEEWTKPSEMTRFEKIETNGKTADI